MNKLVASLLTVAAIGSFFSCKKAGNSSNPQFRVTHAHDSLITYGTGNYPYVKDYKITYTDAEKLSTIKEVNTEYYYGGFNMDSSLRSFNFGSNNIIIDIQQSGTVSRDSASLNAAGQLFLLLGNDFAEYSYNSNFQLQASQDILGTYNYIWDNNGNISSLINESTLDTQMVSYYTDKADAFGNYPCTDQFYFYGMLPVRTRNLIKSLVSTQSSYYFTNSYIDYTTDAQGHILSEVIKSYTGSLSQITDSTYRQVNFDYEVK